jgi:hypothetical protein
MISCWSKHVGVVLGVIVCDIWINVLLYTSALVGPLYIVNWNARWNSENNKPQLAYALHVLNNGHEYGSITNIMSLLKQVNKGPLINSFKHFYFRFHFYHSKLISGQNIVEQNQIYELVLDLHLHEMT